MEWQPIETAPESRLLLLWLEGWHSHSDARWRRDGYALGAMHDGVMSTGHMDFAARRILGDDAFDVGNWYLVPTKWAPLPERPA